MKLQFLGATQTVTGSRYLVSGNGSRVLVDCGLFQGLGKETDMLNRNFGFDPREVEVMIL